MRRFSRSRSLERGDKTTPFSSPFDVVVVVVVGVVMVVAVGASVALGDEPERDGDVESDAADSIDTLRVLLFRLVSASVAASPDTAPFDVRVSLFLSTLNPPALSLSLSLSLLFLQLKLFFFFLFSHFKVFNTACASCASFVSE